MHGETIKLVDNRQFKKQGRGSSSSQSDEWTEGQQNL